MVIVLENTDYSQMLGANNMPYLNGLSQQYTSFSDMYGVAGDSLPNYLELLAGTDDGITSDCDISNALSGSTNTPCPGVPLTNTTLVDQLEAAGIAWHGYFQGDTTGCDQTDGGGYYAYWHNPFRYFSDFSTQCQFLSNFGDLKSNLDAAHPSPFQRVVPDLVNDGGDSGTMSSEDTWLDNELPQIMASTWYREGGQVIITWDSGYNSGTDPNNPAFQGGHEPTVVVSAATLGQGVNPVPVDTAGTLRSIEAAYGLPFLADAANPVNGSLGGAVVPGRPSTGQPPQYFDGGVVSTANSLAGTVTTVPPAAVQPDRHRRASRDRRTVAAPSSRGRRGLKPGATAPGTESPP